MNLCGEVVKHKVFGRGEIIEFSNNYATVLFDESKEEKKFAYPAAFGAFLDLENISLLDVISFELFIGGYFGTSNYIYIDGKRKNKLIRYAKTPGGLHIDLKHLKNEPNFRQDIFLKEIPLTSEQWILFIEEISNLKIAYWKDEYYDNKICDGTQWKLEIRLHYDNKVSKCGSNEYPQCWNKFIEIMKKYINDENFG